MRVPNRLVTERTEKDKTVSGASVDKIKEGRGIVSFCEDNDLTGRNLVEEK